MGLIDDKKNIFNQIGALVSIKEDIGVADDNNSLASINNTKEIPPFLLDMLTVLVGSESLKGVIGEVMTGYIRNVEPSLKTALKKQYVTYNSDQPLPSAFGAAGYKMEMSSLDSYGKLKTDPNTQLGSLLYNNNPVDFDNKMYEAIVNAGTDVDFNGVITMNYDDVLDNVTIKPVNAGDSIGDFTTKYIDSLTLIDESQFVSDITNVIFGTVTTNQNKTETQVIAEEKLNQTIQKIINQAESLDISDDELRQIERTAKDKISGVTFADLGCGYLPNIVTLDSLQGLISGTTGSSDPLVVGNAYVTLLAGGFENTNPTKAKEDIETIKDGFFKRLINAIIEVLVGAITTTTQIRALLGLFTGFKNNNQPEIGDPIDDIKTNSNLISCLSKSAEETIYEFLFNLVKKELINLVIPVSKKILKEKINQYLGIIRSLIGFEI